ncbi:hypothetical protein [Breoghania sp.]|uniref:hypothetical protein n=1 Tax=Breoghania sp. TaxID=2065378 RepID=UPI003204F498
MTDIRVNGLVFTSRRQPLVWLLALVIGVVVALAAILFRVGIGLVQLPWLGTASESVVTASWNVSFIWILCAPIVGGLLVGFLLQTIPKQRTFSVADVMEARARGGHGLPFWPGIS